ncbi:hypothetical protein QWY86_00190 [Pedobacter aquatilis]|uniref:hypothetical protein n=1 Tax=Pedobacter aquatilis TaxID=351343 RepID=UPI0025B52A34|nr:hypothetical protein [Pedobacter aquatilis]MDN3585073.1 hypothetical protein [Pedobacter aquatilis]
MATLQTSNSDNHSTKIQSSNSVVITDNSLETQHNRELFLRFLLENIEQDSEE